MTVPLMFEGNEFYVKKEMLVWQCSLYGHLLLLVLPKMQKKKSQRINSGKLILFDPLLMLHSV